MAGPAAGERSARAVAHQALRRIDEGAYANLVLPSLLARSTLAERDRGFVTELVYGTTRMRRACDFLVDRFLFRAVDDDVRAALRLGAYQLVFLATPAHAAVGETVELIRGPARGLVNAVLHRVAEAGPPPEWPDEPTRLSYPDWIVERLALDLGPSDATAALEQMNQPAPVTERPDGYIQDAASQEVARLVGTRPGERVADLCAAPGGKATLMAQARPFVVAAGDTNPARAGLVAANSRRVDRVEVTAYVGDGRRAPLRPETFDRVLVDAPCTGLGVLRRRPDARWRVLPEAVGQLAQLQRELLRGAVELVRPGGVLAYSVCTLTNAETTEIDEWLAGEHPDWSAEPAPDPPWVPVGRGARLLPQTSGTDGMFLLRLRRPGPGGSS
ncbi:MAG: rRNA cytosine-C5-methyltransferase [Actinobacteria bacterium]|nr:rRNA cytosine-C5-methyltransferase [Actinomycetota bacterium]